MTYAWKTEYNVRDSDGVWVESFDNANEAIMCAKQMTEDEEEVFTVERHTYYLDDVDRIWPNTEDHEEW